MRHERPAPGTICQAEDLNAVLLETRGPALSRELAPKLLAHLGFKGDERVNVRNRAGRYIETTLGRLLPLLTASDLGRCLREEPQEALRIVCNELVLHEAAAAVERDQPGPTISAAIESPCLRFRRGLPGSDARRLRGEIDTAVAGDLRQAVIDDMVVLLNTGRIDRGYADIFDLKRAGYTEDAAASLGPEAAKLLARNIAEQGEAYGATSSEAA